MKLRLLIIILVIILCATIVGMFFFAVNARPVDSIPPAGVLFSLKAGESAASVASRLQSIGALRSSMVFRLLAKIKHQESRLKAGTYSIKPGMGTEAILQTIVSGRQALIKVTIPEGYRLSQVASLLEKAAVCEASQFTKLAHDPVFIQKNGIAASSLEGYLFPDTYFFTRDLGAEKAIFSMLTAFKEKINSFPEAEGLSPEALNEKVILASIIEREYRAEDEAALMAGVFYNRLRIGMALQSCATVVYIITEKLGKPHPEVLFDRDINISDPYNSYIHRGLPPGSISNPGGVALRAAFRPEKSAFLYFRLVDQEEGRHHFSLSLDEHISAKSLYVKRTSGK